VHTRLNAAEGIKKSLILSYRHPGAGRDPVALQSVIAKANKYLLYRENRKPKSLDPGLRRDDD